jgi:hypothetical protein
VSEGFGGEFTLLLVLNKASDNVLDKGQELLHEGTLA